MAPEQASESHAVDPAADIYSLGCTLYHLLVGQPPYSDEGTTPLERLAAHAKRRVPALDRMRPDAPPALVRLAARMTDRRPARRPAAAEVASALEELARGSDLARLFLDAEGAVETRPHPSPTGPSVSRLRRATVALLVLVLCALAALSSPAVYRLVTNRGDLTVEVDDDVAGEVEVRVLGEDVTISSRTGWSVDLKAGAYRLALGGSSDEITLSQDRVEITRLGEVIVRVTSRKSTEPRAVEPSLARTEARPPPAAPAPAAPGTWKPGPPQSDVTSIGRSGPQALGGLVPRPAELPGVGRWQVETTFPRAASIGRWSPDGKRLASVSYQIVRLYDYGHDDGRLLPVACFDIDTWSAQDLRWSPDGSWIVAGHRLLNVRESRLGRVLAGAQSIGEWSPDSRWIATGSPDGIVRLESPEGETRDFSHQHSGAVSLLAWSPDGAWLASGGDDKTVRLWHADGRPGPTLEGHAASISALGWSADSRRLATGSEDSTVRVWSVEGTELATFRGHSSRIERLAFSPDGTRIASYDVRDAERSSFRLWDPDLGRTLLSLPRQGDERVTSFSFQPSGGWLATGAWDGAVRLWDPKEATAGPVLREARGLRDHAPAIGAIDWRPDGLVLATSAWDANTTLWSVESPEAAKEPVERLPGAMSHARHAAWSPDGEWIAVAGADRLVRVFRAATGELRGAWEGHDGPVNAVAWSADSERLASASDDGTARVWKRETGTQEAVLRRSEGPVLAVAWSPTLAETQIATGHADRMVRLWRPRVETPLRELPGHTGPVTCVVFTPDGGRLASGSKDGTCRIWHLAGAAPPTILGAGFGVWTLAFSPDVTRVIAAGGTYAIWNLETGKEERRDVRGGGPGSNIAAWSPAGRWIALGADFTVSFLDGESGESRPGFKAHQFYVSALSWSPDGSRLVSAATDHTLRVWDVSAGDQLWFTVFLPERQHAVFNAAGELLQKSGPEADEHLLYTIEKDDGSLEWLSPEAFLARVRDARKE
jgi:WD40 repeat protein